jgi:hypothetical protein
MANLFLRGKPLESVFELLGSKENDITFSLGWALSNSPAFLKIFVNNIFPELKECDINEIRLQDYKKSGGLTDIEIIGKDIHLIIEAKRGWSLPGKTQLELYTKRIFKSVHKYHALVVMAECSREYVATSLLPKKIGRIPVTYLNWKDIHKLAHIRSGSHAEKRLMEQLRIYLRRIVSMQDQESNMVYVVALGSGTPEWSKISWRDMVNVKKRYFHPVGGTYPKNPPNYIAFRYDGKLQSIHHIESWEITSDMHSIFPEVNPKGWPPHFLYTLGAPIVPNKPIKTGNIYRNGRVWAMLDLLLTSKTISEARDLTKKRQEQDQ